MKVNISGKKDIVASFLERMKWDGSSGGLEHVDYPEFYRYADGKQTVSVVIWTFKEFFNFEIMKQKEFKQLAFCLDTPSCRITKKKGSCRLIWEKKCVIRSERGWDSAKEYEDNGEIKLDDYSTLELYEERFGSAL